MTGPVAPGVLHVGIPFDDRIELSVDGSPVDGRPGFGITTAFDLTAGGTAVVDYAERSSRGWWVASQMILWLVTLVIAAGARSPFGRRRTASVHDETLIDFDTEPSVGVAGEALASWDDTDLGWVDEPIELVAEPAPGPLPGSPPGPGGPSVRPRAPLIVERRADPVEEPVDLAALVARLDADADTDRDTDGDREPAVDESTNGSPRSDGEARP